MKKACLPATLFALFICVLAPSRAFAAILMVDDDGRASSVSCEAANPTSSSIQAAINLSTSGDSIYVCPGVYEEQLKIVGKSLLVRGVTSGDQNLVLVRPRGMVANSTNAYSGGPIAAVVAVENATGVTLRNLTLDGSSNGLAACSPVLIGVFYRNASGAVEATSVRQVRLNEGLETCQSGIGIFAQSGGGGASQLTVSGSSVHDYQKAGIVGNEAGTELVALDNAVAGDGVINTTTQNGIQIAFGATGSVTRNSIVNHVYTCPEFPCDASTSVLVFESDGVTVAGNRTANAVIGIYLVRANDSRVRNNRVADAQVLDGIAVIGNNNRVRLNSITNSDEFALYVEGTGNLVENNTINEAPCGIFASGGNTLSANATFNTELATCEPFTLSFTLNSVLDPSLLSAFGVGLSSNQAATASASKPLLDVASGAVLRNSVGAAIRAAVPAR